MMMRRRYQLLLLAVIVLASFSPAIFAGFSRIDDFNIAEYFRYNHGWDLRAVFLPGAGGGLYYRPLLALTFMTDSVFLGLRAGLMHFENVLIHLVNVVLVYFLTLRIIPSEDRKKSVLPLLAALLFGLHPVNAESVNFLSGRTDLLAGMFIFSSALFLLKFRDTESYNFLFVALFFFLCGVLSKETALAFLPGTFFLMTAERPRGDEMVPIRPGGYSNTILILGCVLSVLIFFSLRSAAFTSNSGRLGLTLMAMSTDWIHSMLVVLRAFGFYMKKLIFPFPLNFAIMEVDPLYEVLAVPLAALCVYVASRRTLLSAFFSAGVLLLVPSFAIAFGQAAWTPYAERYMYLTSAFIVISAVVYLNETRINRGGIYLKVAVSAVLVTMFAVSFNRSMIWQNDLALCKDTVGKSPMAKSVRAVYAGLLAEKGDYPEALRQVELGRSIPSFEYDERFDLVAADISERQGRIDEAIKIDETALLKSRGESINVLQNLISLLKEKKQTCKKESEKKIIDRKIVAYKLQLVKLNQNQQIGSTLVQNR